MQSLVDLLKVKHIGPYNHNTTSKRFLKPDGIKKARQYLIKQFLVGRSFVSVDDIHGAADSGNLRYEKFQLNSGLELILPIDVMTKNLEFSPTCGIPMHPSFQIEVKKINRTDIETIIKGDIDELGTEGYKQLVDDIRPYLNKIEGWDPLEDMGYWPFGYNINSERWDYGIQADFSRSDNDNGVNLSTFYVISYNLMSPEFGQKYSTMAYNVRVNEKNPDFASIVDMLFQHDTDEYHESWKVSQPWAKPPHISGVDECPQCA